MKRKTITIVHLCAALVAYTTIFSFFTSSLVAEVMGNIEWLVRVKRGIFYCLPILLLVMPILGITGNKLGGTSKNATVRVKKNRMKFIMINGFILTGLAAYLYSLATSGQLNSWFFTVQLIELLFGAINLTLLTLMFRDGLKLSGRLKRQQPITSMLH